MEENTNTRKSKDQKVNLIVTMYTFLNSGPSSIEGFAGFFLAVFRVTRPSDKV